MLVNKINPSLNKTNFKGFEHEKNIHGTTTQNFYFPFDYKNREAFIEFYRVKKDNNFFGGYSIDRDFAPVKVELNREANGGTPIDLREVLKINEDTPFAYRVLVQHEAPQADSGMQITETVKKDGNQWNETFTLVTRHGTTPMSRNGLGYLTMVDTHLPGAYYYGFNSDKTGEINYDKDLQLEKEKIKRNSTNKIGGTLAGIEYDLDNLRKKGITTLYVTPIAGSDDVFYHRYTNKNNFQIADEVGNVDNFASFARKLFKNGMTYVFDGTFTSEGSEGVNVQYALKHAHQNPGALYRFRMNGINDGPIGLGIIPQNKENLRYKLVNTPYILEKNSAGKAVVVPNKNYNDKKPSYVQVYDAKLATKEQVESSELIKGYGAQITNDKLAINTYQDVIVPQKNQIYDLRSYKITLENAAKFINSMDKEVELNSPEVALLVTKTPTFEFARKNNNVALWEDKFGMFLRRHDFSGNDEKFLMSIVSPDEREEMRQRFIKGANENIDMDVQTARYWTELYKDIVTYYIAQTAGNVKTSADLQKLVDAKILPAEAVLTDKEIEMIKEELYELEMKGDLERDDVTVKALMKLPLGSLEFAENTVSVLSQSFFTNLAPKKEYIGKTRFELEKMGNPHLADADFDVYTKTNNLFSNEIKNFADEIIKQLNDKLPEKLIDENEEYTEYGEYIIELIGQHIAKYAFLKSLVGKDFIGNYTKAMKNGEIKYNYEAIRAITNLENLGIDQSDMYIEARALQRRIAKGLNNLEMADVEFLANAYAKQLKNTSTLGFRIAEAAYNKSSLGLDWRIDALKDVMDVDAVKQFSNTFDSFWKNIIDYYNILNETIKKGNPGSKVTGEITDMDALTRVPWGAETDMGNFNALKEAGADYKGEADAMRKFWIETGMTTEAGYSHFFSSVFRAFSLDFETGWKMDNGIKSIRENLERLIKERGVDYIRNMFTFVGNHDKPRVIHYSALDMDLFYNGFGIKNGDVEARKGQRELALKLISGVDDITQMPLELRLNVNNADYFRTISPRAVAMSSLVKTGIDGTSADVLNDNVRKYLNKALADLTEGRYLNFGPKVNRLIIDTKELNSLEGAAKAIIEIAESKYGLNLSQQKRAEMIEWAVGYANDNKNLYRYLVQNETENDINKNKSILNGIFQSDNPAEKSKQRNYSEYAPYTICLAGLMQEALGSAFGNDPEAMNKISNALRDYTNKYDKKFLDENSLKFPYSESPSAASRKNGYAAKEFEEVLLMLIEHAEYLAREEKALKEDQSFENIDKIIESIYKIMHEPAMNKAVNMAAILAALPGIATIFAGDEFGMTGGEEKSNNVYNQNRNAVRIEEMRRGFLKKYREDISKAFDQARKVKTVAEALRVGTPYVLKTYQDQVGAWLMQSKNDMVISVVHGNGIREDRHHRFYRDTNYVQELNEIIFPEGMLIPENTKFKNISVENGEEYIVKHFQYNGVGKWFAKLVTTSGENIKMGFKNAPNAAMVLQRIIESEAAKKAAAIAHKGRSKNGQYYISTPSYQSYNFDKKVENGKNLSIIAR